MRMTRPEWYGLPILVADVVWGTVLMASILRQQGNGVALGTVGYLLTGPIIHFGHGQFERGLGSAALRGSSGLLGASVFGAACAIRHLSNKSCDAVSPIVLLALAVPTTLDVVFLAEKQVPVRGATLTPTFDVGPGRLGMGLGGVW